ncbi:transcription factor TFIIIC subunit TFC6 KNAG_0C05000 [Huiozyma naganishii CBS 8797]|uniref:Uncharacterized protein n=1 Tax=Huiozyma naganishii (strain ATCC MYA-139 / BCRC 22969 / CBS 8797 / KCTC 17520 / NBRC 10181 / NCYC 3082 / Yp74L-3) TaxID=1071383 RepID=J7S687_HUIN7|nr:hypothetical protein KNAG_0C05000 [Kazachstania naganishii CBS 8797]CCK69601.1 hypothetical protein KNAG_0C05000 [Kazachstania naganishii CBS 8797]
MDSTGQDIVSTAVRAVEGVAHGGGAGRRRPRRAASKRAGDTVSELVALETGMDAELGTTGDGEFVMNGAEPEDDDEEEEEEEEADDIEIEVIEEESEEEQSTKKKGKRLKTPRAKKPAQAAKRSTNSRASSGPTGSEQRTIRNLRELSSVRDKLEKVYGTNEQKLLQLAKVKEGFETHLFDFPSSNIQQDSRYYLDFKPPAFSETDTTQRLFPTGRTTQYVDITEDQFQSEFKVDAQPVDVLLGSVATSLSPNDQKEFPLFEHYRREGLVYNCGSLVTDMAWLNTEDDRVQFLAVALSQFSNNAADRGLKMFGTTPHKSCIQILQFDPQELRLTKVQTILHNFGDTWNLKWHDGCLVNNDTAIGVLGFTAQDGSVRFIQIRRDTDALYRRCTGTDVTISLVGSYISCFDFLTPTTIICGFQNGFVAEFDLSDDLTVPSLYHKVLETYIISIAAATSKFESTVVSVASIDGYFSLFDPRHIASTKCVVGRSRGSNTNPLVYSPTVYTYLTSDGGNSLRGIPPKASFAVHQINSRDSTVTSIDASRLHPLALSGTADGSLYIDNVARRLLTGVKNISNTHSSLKLWKWDYDTHTGQYRLDHNYSVEKCSVNDLSKIRIDAPGIVIGAVKWIQTSTNGKVYAFSNNAGLLTLEKLPME